MYTGLGCELVIFIFRSLQIVVYFSDNSCANNTFGLWQLSSQNMLASMTLENEGIPLVKTTVHPNVYA